MKKYILLVLVPIIFQQDISCSNSHAKLNQAIQQHLISARNVMNSNVKLELDSLLPALLTDVATGKMSKFVAIAKIKAIKTALKRYKSEHTTWSWWFGSTPEIVKDYINPALAKVDVALKALNASTTDYSFLIGGTSILAATAVVLAGLGYIINNHPQILGIAVVENEVPVRTDTYAASEVRRQADHVREAQEVAAGKESNRLGASFRSMRDMAVSAESAAQKAEAVLVAFTGLKDTYAASEVEKNAKETRAAADRLSSRAQEALVDARAAGADVSYIKPVLANREALFSRSAAVDQTSRRDSDSFSEGNNSSATSEPDLIGEASSSVGSVRSSAAAPDLSRGVAAAIASTWGSSPSSSAVRRPEPASVATFTLAPKKTAEMK